MQPSRTDIAVWWSRLVSFTAEAATALKRTAFSPVVTECDDFGVALFSPDGELVAQPESGLAAFTGCLTRSVPGMLDAFGGPLEPGDVLMTNDPWLGASQLNDYVFVSPVFVEGKLVAYAVNVAHSQDVGGSGHLSARETTVFAEGIQVPVVRIVRAGAVDEQLLEFLLRNVRTPEVVHADFLAQVAANHVLGARLVELLSSEPRIDAVALFSEVLHRSEQAMRRAISGLPDGTWTAEGFADGLADEGDLVVRVTVTVSGDRMVVDFSGTSPQSPYSFNCTQNFAIGRALAPIVAAVRPRSRVNGGTFRAVDFRVPEGSVFDPAYPAALGARSQSSGLIPAVVLRALAGCLDGRVPAESNAPIWAPVLVLDQADGGSIRMLLLNGGMGARPGADGISCRGFPDSMRSVRPEALEEDLPLLVLAQEFLPGSGGPGRFRGGLGQRFCFRWEGKASARLSLRTGHVKYPALGAAGGECGAPGRIFKNGAEVADAKGVVLVDPGDVIELRTPGGGGYGPVERRAPGQVADDVVDGLVTATADS